MHTQSIHAKYHSLHVISPYQNTPFPLNTSQLGSVMTLHHFLLLFTLSLARDELRAYDCRDPEILQVLKHNHCDQPHKDTQQISYNVLQENHITHLESVSCEISIS